MKKHTLYELRKANERSIRINENMTDKNDRKKYEENLYTYVHTITRALTLWESGDYNTVATILELVNIGLDILQMEIVPRGAHRIDSMTEKPQSNKPLTREILRSKYQVTDSFKDVSLNTINDNLPSRLSQDALSKLVKEVFPEVQERKCTNDIKYNLESA